jgi:choline dehydrogenase
MQPLSADKPGDGVHPFSAFTSSVCQLRPFSRGEVVVETSDPMAYPKIYPNYLSDACRTICRYAWFSRPISALSTMN